MLSLHKRTFPRNCFFSFSQGSVIVNFVINFSEEYTEQEIIDLVQTAFDSGLKSQTGDRALLGSYNVQMSSLELNGKIILSADFKDKSFLNLEKIKSDLYHQIFVVLRKATLPKRFEHFRFSLIQRTIHYAQYSESTYHLN